MDIYTAYRLIKQIEKDNKEYMEISNQAKPSQAKTSQATPSQLKG